MSVDNFELIKPILEWRNEDDFYFVSIIKRKKDFPDGSVTGVNNNNRAIRHYFVGSLDYLEFVEQEIKDICNVTGARGCIDLNRRSYENTAFHTLRKVADQIMNKDYTKVSKAYSTACGKHSNEKANKKWILDIDKKLTSGEHTQLKEDLYKLRPVGDKLKFIIPTNSGIHYITSPFNLQAFSELKRWDHIDIHKRNPTALYYPDLNGKT